MACPGGSLGISWSLLPALRCPKPFSKGKISCWAKRLEDAEEKDGGARSETSRVSVGLALPVHAAANPRPGFGTEMRESADGAEIRRPFQQHQGPFKLSLQSYVLTLPRQTLPEAPQKGPDTRPYTGHLKRESWPWPFPFRLGQKDAKTLFPSALRTHNPRFPFREKGGGTNLWEGLRRLLPVLFESPWIYTSGCSEGCNVTREQTFGEREREGEGDGKEDGERGIILPRAAAAHGTTPGLTGPSASPRAPKRTRRICFGEFTIQITSG